MRYFFRVEYDGTAYGGWQCQPNAPSIQESLARAFSIITRQTCTITGAGRTDAGVHASGQGAHIDIPGTITPSACEHSVNAVLPRDIAIYHMQQVPDSFHARYSALSRRYRYTITQRKQPLLNNHTWFLYHRVDWDRVRKAILFLTGEHDFSAFCASGSCTKTNICTVKHAALESGDDCWYFDIEANRFIYKMVRNITGTLIDIGRGRINRSMDDILQSKNRLCGGDTAPAGGLVLEHVGYPPFIIG
jgi:tRNA pseudouridine38-40 synthase